MKSIIALLFFLASLFLFRQLGVVEINAAKFEVKDIKSNIVIFRNMEKDNWYPLSESNSWFNFEDGFIAKNPDYNQKLEKEIRNTDNYNFHVIFPDGEEFISHSEADYQACIELDEFIKSENKKGIIEREVVAKFTGDMKIIKTKDLEEEPIFIDRGVLFNAKLEITGLCSTDYLDFKLKELWLNHLSDIMNFHLRSYDGRRKHEQQSESKSAELSSPGSI